MNRVAALAALLLLAGCPGSDSLPPTATILDPVSGDTVAGIVTVLALATDDDRVESVELLVDDTLSATEDSPAGDTFRFELDTSTLEPGTTHVLVCVARDPGGNRDSSPPVSVFVTAGSLHRGTINGDETWRTSANPHLVEGELVIRATVTLEPGVLVRLAPGALISVGKGSSGALLARGQSGNGITFTSTSTAPGDWLGIAIAAPGGSDTSEFSWCTIEYGGGNGQALISTQGSPVIVRSCNLRRAAAAGLRATGSGLVECSGTRFEGCGRFPLTIGPAGAAAVGPGNSFAGNTIDGIEVTGGTVTATAVWQNPGVPWYVSGTVDVADPSNPLLTVAPGCSLLFADSASLRIGVGFGGAIQADGGTGPVVFGAYATSPGPLTWPGIEFLPGADTAQCYLYNCRIEDAGANGVAALLCYIPVTILGTTVSGSASSGISFLATGANQFTGNVVTGCAGYPVEVEAGYAGTLGSGNLLAGNGHDSIRVARGDITRNSQWRDHGIPYLITDEVNVGATGSPSLVIDRGAVLAFGPSGVLRVGNGYPGELVAIGSEQDSIVFTGTTAAAGAWRGIELLDQTRNSSVLEYCQVLYGASNERLGIVYIRTCAPRVVRNEIAFSPNCCIALIESPLDPDQLEALNWLHDWNEEDFDAVYWE